MKQQYIRTIKQHSEEKKDFIKAMNEWILKDMYYGCANCICSKNIYNVYVIENKYNDITLLNGCDCILKLDDCRLKYQVKIFDKYQIKIKNILNPNKNTRFEKKINDIYDEYVNKVKLLYDEEIYKNYKFINYYKNNTISFGKYKNKKYNDIPDHYYRWCCLQKNMNDDKLNDYLKFYYDYCPSVIKKIDYSKSLFCT